MPKSYAFPIRAMPACSGKPASRYTSLLASVQRGALCLDQPAARERQHKPSCFMAAMESLIVTTAMPTIVAKLGGCHLFSWAFAAYLLTQAATIPNYGRLADIYGRKPVFFAGAGLFLLASTLCGLAWGMLPLVLFPALQEAGAGAIQPIANHHYWRHLSTDRTCPGAGLHLRCLGASLRSLDRCSAPSQLLAPGDAPGTVDLNELFIEPLQSAAASAMRCSRTPSRGARRRRGVRQVSASLRIPSG